MKGQSIKKNYVLNTMYQVLTMITPLITAPYVSRVLGAEGIGIFSYTSSVIAFFLLFASLGTMVYGQRCIAQCRDDDKKRSKTFWEIEILSVITTLICSIAWIGFIIIYPKYRIFFLILSFDLLSTALDISWFYAGLEEYQFIVLRNTVVKLASIALIFILVRTAQDLWLYIAIMTAGKLCGNISMWLPLRKLVISIPLKQLDIKPHFKETFAYFIPTAAATVYTYLDKVMLEGLTGSTLENGYYEQANKIIKMGYTVVISLNTVMSSRISYMFSQNRKNEIKEMLEKALGVILILSFPIMLGIVGISKNFVPWFFGDGYDKVILLMMVSSLLVPILSLHNFLSAQYLIPSGQRTRSTKGVLLGALVNFILNAILIPRLSSLGAIIASIIAESSICVVYWYMSREYVPLSIVLKYAPKQLLSSLIMLAVIILVGGGKSGDVMVTVCQIVAGVCVYGVCLLLLRDQLALFAIKKAKQFVSAKGKR